jgi:hypothetical protein
MGLPWHPYKQALTPQLRPPRLPPPPRRSLPYSRLLLVLQCVRLLAARLPKHTNVDLMGGWVVKDFYFFIFRGLKTLKPLM